MQIVKNLLNRASLDIDFNKQDRFGDTSLMHAVRSGNTDLVRLLVNIMQRLSIDIDVKNHCDITPYLEAKRFGFEEIAEVLKNDGNVCQSLKICPLIFDENSEDAYNKESAVKTAKPQKNRKPDLTRMDHNWMKGMKGKLENRLRQVKSAQEKRVYTENSRGKGSEVVIKDADNENKRQNKRERSKSEPKQIDRVLYVNIRNAEELTNSENENGRKSSKEKRKIPEFINEQIMQNKKLDVSEKEVKKIEKEADTNGTNSSLKDSESRDKMESEVKNLKPIVQNTSSQPEIAVSVENEDHTNEIAQERLDSAKNRGKNMWLKQLQKRGQTWKRKIQLNESKEAQMIDVKDEHRTERPFNLEIKRETTLSGGALRKLLIDKPSTPTAPRRCSSNLSVYFNSYQNVLPRSRPGSAFNIPEKHENINNFTRKSIVQEPIKPKITYEEVFAICPEMKNDTKHKWYTDLRWMLALKAHQSSSTYLPAQPEAYEHENTDSDTRNDSEGSRLGRRVSVLDIKRPMLKKRHSTLTPTALRELKE